MRAGCFSVRGMGDLGRRVVDTHAYYRIFKRVPRTGVLSQINAPRLDRSINNYAGKRHLFDWGIGHVRDGGGNAAVRGPEFGEHGVSSVQVGVGMPSGDANEGGECGWGGCLAGGGAA